MKIRPKLVLWHRWFGVFAALWLALMGITGSIIVFYGELDTWFNQDLKTTQHRRTTVSLDAMVAAAERHLPGSSAVFIDPPDKPGETTAVFLSFPNSERKRVQAFVDPFSGEVLGDRVLGAASFDRRNIMNLFYDLHMDLLLGDKMLWFLGLVSFLWLIDHFLVLGISFPALKQWARSFLIRRNARRSRFQYDLHRASGLWLFPVTLMLAVSGLFFTWNHEFVSVVNALSPTNSRHVYTLEKLGEPLHKGEVTFGAAEQIARDEAGREIDVINYFPHVGAYMARAFDPRDIDPYGRRLITIDATSGAVLADQHAASGSAGDVFLLWQYPLHSGKAFGWPGRLLIFASGIVLTLLCITGLVLWWRKLKARKGF